MSSLFINDLDAGAGRMGGGTQYTVNNQMVNATLMNIADNPTNVQLPGVYKDEAIPRVPVVCTGNDFSTLYAPLIRDGRMEKFYWAPTREDRVGVCMGIFQHDGIGRLDVETIVDTFPGQSIDFFGALRARVYDDKARHFQQFFPQPPRAHGAVRAASAPLPPSPPPPSSPTRHAPPLPPSMSFVQVREFIETIGFESIGKRLVNSREGKVEFEKPKMDLDTLLKYGAAVVQEQENVKRVQLADEYLDGAALAGAEGTSLPEAVRAR